MISVSPSQYRLQDADNHSVASSAGSDTISSVSQDGNRLSVATSGYSSDPNRSTKLSFSGVYSDPAFHCMTVNYYGIST